MPVGRNQVAYDDIGFRAVTFKFDGSIVVNALTGASAQIGLAVALKSADTVGLAIDAETITGKLIAADSDGFCTVQVEGFTTLPSGTGAVLPFGYPIVGCLLVAAAGYIRGAVATVPAELAKGHHKIINFADLTAVVVHLG